VSTHDFEIGSVPVGRGQLFLIAGPCVIESEQHARTMADAIQRITGDLGVPYIFKASYDKANRTSVASFRGPGLTEGTRILRRIAEETRLPVLTDVHEPAHCAAVAEACDVLQIPAFLCRQTDLLVAAGKTGRAINVKKGQFVAPEDMKHAVEKIASTGNTRVFLTERGASFGYHNLVVDMRSLPIYFSLCQYGWDSVWKWGPTVGGNSWRTTDDIEDNYMSMSNIGFAQAGLSKYAGPGHWNDPDMLEVGNGKMKYNEYLTHMSLWAILAAPLLAGNDLSQMSAETKSILMNKDVIAIDQDPLGKQGDRVSAEGPFEVWSKPLKDGSIAVGLFNRGHDAEQMSLPLQKLGLSASSKIRNVWNPADSGHGPWMIPEHGVVLLIVKK
jgi:2-dehydro-3-deoxyphosphooctonate aldolase (KDO 8-P synthase)